MSRSVQTVNATGAAAIAVSLVCDGTIASVGSELIMITCHLDSAPTTAEAFTVTLNQKNGAAYDTVLYSIDPSASSATNIVFVPRKRMRLAEGDSVDVAYPNTDTNTYGVNIYFDAQPLM